MSRFAARKTTSPRRPVAAGPTPTPRAGRLAHYFTTYKLIPGRDPDTSIEQAYGREHALKVVAASIEDYEEGYGG